MNPQPTIKGTPIGIQIYKCLEYLSHNIGETTTEYHWREFCGLMKTMEDEKMIEVVRDNNIVANEQHTQDVEKCGLENDYCLGDYLFLKQF